MSKSLITINPRVGFGRPTIRGTGIKVATVCGRWMAGETIPDIAEDYELREEQIIAAVYYQLGRITQYRSKHVTELLQPDDHALYPREWE